MGSSDVLTLDGSPAAAPNHVVSPEDAIFCDASCSGWLLIRMLPALLDFECCFSSRGMAGTGGASCAGTADIDTGLLLPPALTALPLLPGLPGLGLRNVRSVMLPWLPRLLSSPLGLPLLPRDSIVAAVPLDETEPLRRIVRFVWTSPTLIGVVGRFLSAAAAAAEDSETLGLLVRLKTARAAVAAFGFAVALVKGCACLSWEDRRRISFIFGPVGSD
jgi:hypothetical protein